MRSGVIAQKLGMTRVFTDAGERYRMDLSNGALTHHPTTREDPADAVVTLTKPQLLALLGGAELDPAIVQGDASAIATIMGFTDEPDPQFEVVAP